MCFLDQIQEAAKAKGMAPDKFCASVSQEFKDLWDCTDVSYDHYIRTTEERHVQAVQAMWHRLETKGFIYKGKYEGWYCMSDEAFLTSTQVVDGHDKTGKPCKVSAESGHVVEWVTEENYKFRLSAFQEPLLQWLNNKDTNGEAVILPRTRMNEVLAFLRDRELQDLSVSR